MILDLNTVEAVPKARLQELHRMATVVSDSNDAVILHDFDGNILAWNRGAMETYGYRESEALSMNVRDIVAEPDRDAALALIERIKSGEAVKSFELRRITKDGRTLDVWLTTTLLVDNDGLPVAIATTERDITERKRDETILKQQIEELRRMATVVSDSNDAVILHDFDGRILAWNRGAKDTYGYSESEALGMNVRDIVAEPDRHAALALIQRVKSGERVKSFELRRITKDGRTLDVWLTTTLLVADDGLPVAIATTERDITERNRDESILKQQVEELRRMATVVSDSNDAVILHDFDGNILAWNRGAMQTYGYSESEALVMNVRDIVAESDRDAALLLIRRIKSGEAVKSFELRRRTKDGRTLDVWLTKTLLTDNTGNPIAIATTERDITDRKKAEAEIHKLNADLSGKIAQLVDAQEELVRTEKLAVLGQVSGSIGHELRNPLGVMSNAVYYLQATLPDADAGTKEYLAIIQDEIATSERIVGGLLDSVRTSPARLEPTGVERLIRNTLAQCTIPPTVAVTLTFSEDLPPMLVDPLQLKQVFMNLISNGVEAMPDGGTLAILASLGADDRMVIRIRDSGSGIGKEQLDKLFQPLFTTKARGIGLGLVIVKNLVQANGGSVEVESTLGNGSTFLLTLPTVDVTTLLNL